ncbi:MAG: rod shape-determining protein MreD [Rikenellaceae bacterium]
MFRILPYIALLLTAVLSQIFIFDSLSTSVLVAPLVYIVFIVLLPIESSQIVMLGCGVMLGLIMDAAMGTSGLNSIASIAIAFFRAPILKLIVGDKRSAERGVPSEISFGDRAYLRYIVIVVALHHAIFFLFESLSAIHMLYTLWRFTASTAVSILFVWLIARLFLTNKLLK